jgi:hypothetical protein
MHPDISIKIPESEDIYDWHGHQLKPEVRKDVGMDNIVRIQFAHANGYAEAIYVKIIAVDGEFLKGRVLDLYRTQEEYVRNGEIVSFLRDMIMEIPLEGMFQENKNLKHIVEKRTGKKRGITGVLP